VPALALFLPKRQPPHDGRGQEGGDNRDHTDDEPQPRHRQV